MVGAFASRGVQHERNHSKVPSHHQRGIPAYGGIRLLHRASHARVIGGGRLPRGRVPGRARSLLAVLLAILLTSPR